MQAGPKSRPHQLCLKTPSSTGPTVYRKDFQRKHPKYNHQEDLQHNISTIDCLKNNHSLACNDPPRDTRINDRSAYQRDFKYFPLRTESCSRLRKRLDTSVGEEDKAPRFLETQNKIDFLNWAGKSYVPSMKPQDRPATTNLPFEGCSVYKADFDSKTHTPTPVVVRPCSYPNFSCVGSQMRSNYSIEFAEKKSECEANCKPRHFDSGLCKLFKGTTEYKREFAHSPIPDSEPEEPTCKTLADMQTLIIDL